ncbi:hypothetical protein GOP47_0006144 [Adiantum capillus-veneris]|uniref:Uncharacterized protein n=1 Tax=Adiantum capillus-veneris TaxID=13818 RepID=A0A9D4ZK15_ADICA|nr:hypothetical protein GOP47_0006144 [Adiantum capillus-veneris]
MLLIQGRAKPLGYHMSKGESTCGEHELWRPVYDTTTDDAGGRNWWFCMTMMAALAGWWLTDSFTVAPLCLRKENQGLRYWRFFWISLISFGSPPVRASNPLIYMMYISHKRKPLPQNYTCKSGGNSTDKKSSSCGTSYVSKPFVRIEGLSINCSHMGGIAISAAFVDTAKL